MQKSVVVKARTVEEAIETALKQLGANRDEVETKVLELPGTGFIGKIGKQAKVEVSILEKPEEMQKDKAIHFLTQLTKSMRIPAEVEAFSAEEDILNIELTGEDMRLLIGRRGVTLDALQYLTSLAVNKDSEPYTKIILDTEGYRAKRQTALEEFASKMANKAVRTRRRVELEPMNPYERRIIHASLQDNRKVMTRSEGEEPYRKIIIEVKRKERR